MNNSYKLSNRCLSFTALSLALLLSPAFEASASDVAESRNYTCAATHGESSQSQLRGLILEVVPSLRVVRAQAVVAGFTPELPEIEAREPFSVVVGSQNFSSVSSEALLKSGESTWSARSIVSKAKLMQRPFFRKDHFAIEMRHWEIPSLPPVPDDEAFESIAKTALRYFQAYFNYDGRFLIPKEVLVEPVKNFEAQLYFRGELEPEYTLPQMKKLHSRENYFEVECTAIDDRQLNDLRVLIAEDSASKHLSEDTVKTDMSLFKDALETLSDNEITIYQKRISLSVVIAGLAGVAYRLAVVTKMKPLLAGVVPPGLMESLMLSDGIAVPNHSEFDIDDLLAFVEESQKVPDANLEDFLKRNQEMTNYLFEVLESVKKVQESRRAQRCMNAPLSCV